MTTVFIVTKKFSDIENLGRTEVEVFSTREGAEKFMADFEVERNRLRNIQEKFAESYQKQRKAYLRNTGAYYVSSEIDGGFYREARLETGFNSVVESALFNDFDRIEGPEECKVQQ